jgi:hypothetical protein
MFASEPILICISLYTSFVYGIPFMLFQFFPIVFDKDRGWGPVVSNLPFLTIFVGSFVGTAINFAAQPWYRRAVTKNNGQAVPEARLPPIVIGAGLLSVGLFWFGWTASPKTSWISPIFAGGKYPLLWSLRRDRRLTVDRFYRSRFHYCFSTMPQLCG